MSVLDVDVSYYESVRHTENPERIKLSDWLTDDLYKEILLDLRNLPESEYGKQKKLLPGITPSSTFSKRTESGLIDHSGLIQFDIDANDNPGDMNFLKEKIKLIPFVAYISYSTSGQGLWGLIPIEYPTKHQDHFKAIESSFKKQGINIDPAPSNVASFRFVSYDPEPYLNLDAKVYHYLISDESQKIYPPQKFNASGARIKSLIDQIQLKRIDITTSYDNWIKIGFAIVDEYSEAGRDFFHAISQFHPGYDSEETDKQFTKCLESNGTGVTISTLFHICKNHGIRAKANYTDAHDKPLKSKFENQIISPYGMNPYTGEIFDERGYPADWDDI